MNNFSFFPIFFSVFFTTKITATEEEKCPKGWYHDIEERACYFIARRKMTHPRAHQFCRRISNNSHLLRVECDSENVFITDVMRRGASVWVDARARFDIVDSAAGLFAPGLVLRWPNGKIVRYTKWGRGQGLKTASKSKKCVQLSPRGEWMNSECARTAQVICEKRLRRPGDGLCPKHWTFNNHTQSCYRALTKTNMSILDADDQCFHSGREHGQDAMLTSITSEEENNLVEGLAKEKNKNFDFVMLGGFGRSNNGNKWKWMDGNSFSYQNWDRGMPFGRKELAVLVMNRRGKWLNHYADKVLSQFDAVAVCKFKP